MTDPLHKRFPSKRSSFLALRGAGVDFSCIIDVGVKHQTAELVELFAETKQFLFEPVSQHNAVIRHNYIGIDFEIINAAVSDTDGDGKMWTRSVDGSGTVTHSHVVTQDQVSQIEPEDVTGVNLIRLDSFIRARRLEGPILLKIDVDGHEPKVIGGLQGAVGEIGAVVIEADIRSAPSRIAALSALGLVLWDIVDLIYYRDCLQQIDLIFVSPELALRPALAPFRSDTNPDWTKWQPLVEATKARH